MRVRDLMTFWLVACLVTLFFMPPLAIIMLGLFFPFYLIYMFFAGVIGLIVALFDRT